MAVTDWELTRHSTGSNLAAYQHHGGFFDVSPVVLEVSYDDHWYLVVDSNDRRIKVQFTEVFD